MNINNYFHIEKQKYYEKTTSEKFLFPDIDKIPQNIKYLWIIDYPTPNDYKQNSFLSGRAGKTGKKIIESYKIAENFNEDIFIIPKIPLVAETIQNLSTFKSKYDKIFEELQILMIDILVHVYKTFNPEFIWLLETPGSRMKNIMNKYYEELELLHKKRFFNKQLKLFNSFANNNFELDFLRFFYNNYRDSSVINDLNKLGDLNLIKFFK
ncbi:MAG: hypothetical protein Kow0068_22300 [Marinilabiliales bacterium]